MLYPILLLGLSAHVLASESYSLADTYMGNDFFEHWQWETLADPTHGRVNYVDQATAQAKNLSMATENSFVMRADNTNRVPPASRGRDSVRITSKAAYETSVMVLNLWHMPTGCGTWPAWWSLSKAGPWPHGGEVDMIEGVNKNENNLASMHTAPNCTMSQQRNQRGHTVSTNCDATVNYNQGCGVSFDDKPNSFGKGFNNHGGGWYAVERSATCGVSIWFWSRNDPSVPIEVKDGLSTVNPDPGMWGMPQASFPVDTCDQSRFDAHQVVFDLTFCGDWAGSAFSTAGCGPSSCQEFVDNNPAAFTDAYWEIESLRTYTPANNYTDTNVPLFHL
ncbi:glycoside hydrolase family 16 protein [Mycena rebaudengoi]|nr:glycoside hydrolase family 16 protein [Mycena rebaudengoi]